MFYTLAGLRLTPSIAVEGQLAEQPEPQELGLVWLPPTEGRHCCIADAMVAVDNWYDTYIRCNMIMAPFFGWTESDSL